MKFVDVFAGCGGLSEGFKSHGGYTFVAGVEWDKSAHATLVNRLEHFKIKDAATRCVRFDVQRTEELFSGWENDDTFGSGCGLDTIVSKYGKPNLLIGGPPCQAYSIAGRIRDPNGMRDDYRNFLFESYIEILKRLDPEAFVFENVQGLLSAAPKGVPIVETIRASFRDAGYEISDNLASEALFNAVDFGVPQNRKRLIIVGVKTSASAQTQLAEIYSDLRAKFVPIQTVRSAIEDLPAIEFDDVTSGWAASYPLMDHVARYHGPKDRLLFAKLCIDALSESSKYKSTKELIRLYEEHTGKTSKIHKYHVIDWDKPSNTIVAHLQKDGLRHIHPDPKQTRSITVREAARLQTFPDDFSFHGSMGDKFRMIGNAVPPRMASAIADVLLGHF